MKIFFMIILSVFIYNTSCGQSIKKNSDIKFIDFVNSFKEEQINDIIDFRKIIHNKASMSKEEALKYVYNTKDTTRLYCIEFDYSNETEEFRGVLGAYLYLPDKCLKINMGNYFFIAYNSYQCINSLPAQNKLRESFLNEDFNTYLTLCIVDKGYNLRNSILVCKDDGYEHDISGVINPRNGKLFLNTSTTDGSKAYIYTVNKDLRFEIVKEEALNIDSHDDLMKMLEMLEWKELFLE